MIKDETIGVEEYFDKHKFTVILSDSTSIWSKYRATLEGEYYYENRGIYYKFAFGGDTKKEALDNLKFGMMREPYYTDNKGAGWFTKKVPNGHFPKF